MTDLFTDKYVSWPNMRDEEDEDAIIRDAGWGRVLGSVEIHGHPHLFVRELPFNAYDFEPPQMRLIPLAASLTFFNTPEEREVWMEWLHKEGPDA